MAPTPSGFLHIGNIASFALTSAYAEASGAAVLLRIDDMDRDRADARFVADIFETLDFLEIPYNVGPRNADDFESRWSQTKRLANYTALLDALKATGRVFACTCSRTDILKAGGDGGYPGTCRHRNLPFDTPGAAWRLDTEGCAPVAMHRAGGGLSARPLSLAMRHFIVRKKDGFPAYQTTSVADDVHFGVDLVVRGADLADSTAAQLLLARAAGFAAFGNIAFWHHPLINDAEGRKLSKSEGAQSVRFMRMAGMAKGAVLNVVAQSLGIPAGVGNWAELTDDIIAQKPWLVAECGGACDKSDPYLV